MTINRPRELEIAAEYYNQKYPERGEIHVCFLQGASCESDYHEQINSIASRITQYPAKIIITTRPYSQTLEHSHPCILTKDKLISLRQDNRDDSHRYNIANKLGVTLINPKSSESDYFQEDYTSCHFIALAILKDLTREDISELSDYNNEYLPMAKMMKYCQSPKVVQKVLSDEGKETAVKKDGRTVKDYITQRFDTIFSSRIEEKEERWMEVLSEVYSKPSNSVESVAKEVLQKTRESKGCDI